MPGYGYGGIKRSARERALRDDEETAPCGSPFMAQKTAAMIAYANCLRYPAPSARFRLLRPAVCTRSR